MIVVDTSVWIDFLRGHASVEARILTELLRQDADIALTGIIVTEILQGVSNDRQYKTLVDRLSGFPLIEPRGRETYVAAAKLFRDCRRMGRTVRATVDCIIAAICIECGAQLLHKDADYGAIGAVSALKVFPVPTVQ